MTCHHGQLLESNLLDRCSAKPHKIIIFCFAQGRLSSVVKWIWQNLVLPLPAPASASRPHPSTSPLTTDRPRTTLNVKLGWASDVGRGAVVGNRGSGLGPTLYRPLPPLYRSRGVLSQRWEPMENGIRQTPSTTLYRAPAGLPSSMYGHATWYTRPPGQNRSVHGHRMHRFPETQETRAVDPIRSPAPLASTVHMQRFTGIECQVETRFVSSSSFCLMFFCGPVPQQPEPRRIWSVRFQS